MSTSNYRRSSSGPSSDPEQKASLVRWESTSTYEGLKTFASASNASMNTIVNEAVAEFLSKPERTSVLTEAVQRQQDAIRKLSGG
jgi:hypothetical protein